MCSSDLPLSLLSCDISLYGNVQTIDGRVLPTAFWDPRPKMLHDVSLHLNETPLCKGRWRGLPRRRGCKTYIQEKQSLSLAFASQLPLHKGAFLEIHRRCLSKRNKEYPLWSARKHIPQRVFFMSLYEGRQFSAIQ